jgi:hypothetical protein
VARTRQGAEYVPCLLLHKPTVATEVVWEPGEQEPRLYILDTDDP